MENIWSPPRSSPIVKVWASTLIGTGTPLNAIAARIKRGPISPARSFAPSSLCAKDFGARPRSISRLAAAMAHDVHVRRFTVIDQPSEGECACWESAVAVPFSRMLTAAAAKQHGCDRKHCNSKSRSSLFESEIAMRPLTSLMVNSDSSRSRCYSRCYGIYSLLDR